MLNHSTSAEKTQLSLSEMQGLIDEMSDLPVRSDPKLIGAPIQIGNQIIFARIFSDRADREDSMYVANITTFKNRDHFDEDHLRGHVYLSGRRNSIFHSQEGDLFQLIKEGWRLYPVEEYEHGLIAIRSLGGKSISSKKALEGFLIHPDVSLRCRFDSSIAFYAIKIGSGKYEESWIKPFTNWRNGYAWGYEIISASLSENHSELKYENSDTSCGFYDESQVNDEAKASFVNVCNYQLEELSQAVI
jgi:hypothetical protein